MAKLLFQKSLFHVKQTKQPYGQEISRFLSSHTKISAETNTANSRADRQLYFIAHCNSTRFHQKFHVKQIRRVFIILHNGTSINKNQIVYQTVKVYNRQSRRSNNTTSSQAYKTQRINCQVKIRKNTPKISQNVIFLRPEKLFFV